MASGYYSFVAGAKPLASEWNDYVSKQAVMVFASTAARDSALSSVLREGMLCYVTGTDRFYFYTGSTWIVLAWSSGGRVGCALARAASQSINNTTQTTISWDTELADSDGFIATTATTVTIPSGMGGIYAITGRVVLASGTTHFINLNAGSRSYDSDALSSITTNPTMSITVPLAAADTITMSVYQASGGAMNVTASLDVYRIGI